jgi:hypothetical protein
VQHGGHGWQYTGWHCTGCCMTVVGWTIGAGCMIGAGCATGCDGTTVCAGYAEGAGV